MILVLLKFLLLREMNQKETKSFLSSLKNNIKNNKLSFDSLAQIYSQDPGTASSGGYLGFTSRGSLVKEYEDFLFLKIRRYKDPLKQILVII